MRKDLTDIVAVIDRSGSMISCRRSAEDGFNEFIKGQRNLPGEARLTLLQFDNEADYVYDCVPLADVTHYSIQPRGATALLDALGKAINDTGRRLERTPEAERPGLVVFVIVTDGQENASREFTNAQIADMTKHQQDKYSWQFTYLGANQDAFAAAQQIGLSMAAAANYAAAKSPQMYGALHANVTRMRKAVATDDAVVNEYTAKERSAMS